MNTIERVLEYIYTKNMIASGDAVLIAVSGGADSVALLHLLVSLKEKLNISIHVAHLNHMFRGQESVDDAAFVQSLCEKWELPCVVESRDVAQYQRQQRLSTQVAARDIRYQFLEQVARRQGCTKIALGHHADDQAETVVLNLLRGTGVKGLTGMPPVRSDFFIRPLLTIRRYEIESYCTENGLDYRNDSSNNKEVYLRNRVRLGLLPLIEKDYNCDFIASLNRLADICREEDDFIEQQTKEAFIKIADNLKGSIVIRRHSFNNLHLALKRRIIRWVWKIITGEKRGLSFYHVESVVRQSDCPNNGIVELPAGYFCKLNNESIEIKHTSTVKTPEEYQYKLHIPGTTIIKELGMKITACIYSAAELKESPAVFAGTKALLDYDATGNQLVVRQRMPGDRFNPLGTSGSVKLKKFFIDQKVPQEERGKTPLVCKGNEIIWVSGLRVGEYWKVTKNTTKILHLELTQCTD